MVVGCDREAQSPSCPQPRVVLCGGLHSATPHLGPSWAVCVFASGHLGFSLSPVISMRCMVQFVGREAKYRWVILLGTGRRGLLTTQSLPGQAVLGQSLPLFCPSSNVLTSGERGGLHRLFPGAFCLYLLSGLPRTSLGALQRG